MKNKQNKANCKSRTKAGKPCRAAATAGGLCYFHANPDKTSELGRIGGRKNGRAAVESADPLPRLDNAQAVRDTLARLISDVLAGKLHPRRAAVLVSMLNLQLRTIETTDLERRIAQLEKGRAEAEETAAVSDVSLEVASHEAGNAPPSEAPSRDEEEPSQKGGPDVTRRKPPRHAA